MKGAPTSGAQSEMPAASRQRSASRRSISSSSRSMRVGPLFMPIRVERASDGIPAAPWVLMALHIGTHGSDLREGLCGAPSIVLGMPRSLHVGPARVPSRESPEAAVEALLARGLSACEIDFEGRFWMDSEFAERFGELAHEHDIALSVHAPIAGFMGHAERGKKLNMAVGMLDPSAGIAKAAGAEVVVFHPGFLLGRTREEAIDSVVEQLGELRERLGGEERGAPLGSQGRGPLRG